MKRMIMFLTYLIIVFATGCNIYDDEIKDVKIMGCVYDKATAAPLPGVYIYTYSTDDEQKTQTDANGYFYIKTKVNCEAGSMNIEFCEKNKKSYKLYFSLPEANPCKIPPLVVYLEDIQW